MTPFQTVHSRAVSFPEANVDTDIIFPARFLLITEKRGLGRYAFHDRRGSVGFDVDRIAAESARILLVGENFGCGSSREQAPWALKDLGLDVLIGPSFGEIFLSNGFKNGMLLIALPEATLAGLRQAAEAGATFSVDLETQVIRVGDTATYAFAIDPARRDDLLSGLDEIAQIRSRFGEMIGRFEAAQRQSAPWLWIQETEGHHG